MLLLILAILFSGSSSASVAPPASELYNRFSTIIIIFKYQFLFIGYSPYHFTTFAEIVSGVVSNVVTALIKWVWSLKSTPKTGTDLSPDLTFP